MGERLAAQFLTRHGLAIRAANVRLNGGEIDLLAEDENRRVAVEVKTRLESVDGEADPLDSYTPEKAIRVHRLASLVGADRVDVVAVHIVSDGVEFRWLRG